MNFFYKRYDQDIVNSLTDEPPVPDSMRFMFQAYITLLLSALSAASGALLHHFHGVGRPETALNIVISVWLLSYVDKRKQIYHCVLLLACSLFFGATVGPIIKYFVDIEQRSIIFFFGGYALTVCFHLFAICSRNMRVIFTINIFNLPLLMFSFIFAHVIFSHGTFFDIDIPLNIQTITSFVVSIPIIWYVGYLIYKTKTWDWGFVVPLHFVWLTVLTTSFHYNLFHLMCIYTFVVFGFHHLKLHDFDCHCFVIGGGPIDRAATNILTFYTNFVGRSSYLLIHFGQILVDYIWKKICTFCVEEWEPGMTFCVEALKAGCALFYLAKGFIVRVILTSIVVVSFSILFFLYLATKVQG